MVNGMPQVPTGLSHEKFLPSLLENLTDAPKLEFGQRCHRHVRTTFNVEKMLTQELAIIS
jgi:hypothetical protein